MRLQRIVLLACLLRTVSLFAAEPIAPISAANALTLPAQRHVVRLEPADGGPVWLMALQQAGQQGRGLGFFRSDDEGQTWHYAAPIQNDWTHRDTADLLPVGADIALVYSHEAPALRGSELHDVYFQWWRYQTETRTWAPSAPVRVFDSVLPSTGYLRAELARDSRGRIWVQAFHLEPDGTFTAVVSVSEDEGLTFQTQPSLTNLPHRGGGRLLHLGDRLLFVYGHHGSSPAWFRMRMDSEPLDAWQPEQQAFPEGIYHGAALSAVSPGGGRMHLVYKSVDERLFYRAFDGTAFGPPLMIQSAGNWALQPAATLVGDELVVFYNPPISLNTHHTLAVQVLFGGSFSPPQVLENSVQFRGYPAAPERLPATATRVPCIYGEAPDAATAGSAALTSLELGLLQPGLEVVHTNTTHRFLAVAPSGTAYALRLDDS
ncbi:MAG TPA: exo-alpha-sialidase, partial [Myxococcaceae bacterium]|nr:exo-alpha-sialidase [Myxococcaceae bacterium]